MFRWFPALDAILQPAEACKIGDEKIFVSFVQAAIWI